MQTRKTRTAITTEDPEDTEESANCATSSHCLPGRTLTGFPFVLLTRSGIELQRTHGTTSNSWVSPCVLWVLCGQLQLTPRPLRPPRLIPAARPATPGRAP